MEHPRVYAGVDTHSDTHTLALIDEHGRPLTTQTFTADPTGYERLVAMIGDPGDCLGIGVEGTNSYGAALTRRLVEAGYDVHEVLRPKRSVRRGDGKSDPVDALAAARSVLAGDGTSVPKSTDGWVEALRALNAERAQLVTAMTALSNSATGLLTTAPEHIRERYRGSHTSIRMRRLVVCRPSGNMVEQGMLVALKASGKAWKALKEQADLLERSMRLILEEHARPLLGIYCASTVTASCTTGGSSSPRARAAASARPSCSAGTPPRNQKK
ncbi:IS110 transposase [Bifidobacterium thermophilum]|nr:IS110 transposase [Bifidobacterium thermophilum]